MVPLQENISVLRGNRSTIQDLSPAKQNSSQDDTSILQKARKSLRTPYSIILDANVYHNAYEAYLPVQDNECGLHFKSIDNPYIENYFARFEKYATDNHGHSTAAEKQVIMNEGDILLAVNDADVGGKSLSEIISLISESNNEMVHLTFLNKDWFNKYDHDNVKITDDKNKG